MHDTKEWCTDFDGPIQKIQIDGQEILQIHDLARKTEDISRQIRFIAVLASTIAIAVLILVSMIYNHNQDLDSYLHEVLTDRTSEWRYSGDKTLRPSKVGD